jgi:hypothetical protein
VNFAGQYYFKRRQNDYDHDVDTARYNPPANVGNLYPAFIRNHDFDTHDVNFRTTWRPWPNLTLVSRYDYQLSTIDTRGDVNNLGISLKQVESSEAITHIFSQSASWSPLARLYLQGSISYVLDQTETPASDLTGTAANVVQDAENDYWNASVLTGYALTERADFQVQYHYYRADNYSDNSSVSLPYGAGAEQHGVTATLLHRIRKNLLWKLQYGFFTGDDETSGGNNEYDAHLVYSSLQYLF